MPTRCRADQVAALYAAEHDELEHIVARRARHIDAQTIEDACSYAWMQMLRHSTPDLDNEPRPRLIGWLVTTAVRRASTLNATQRRTTGVTEHQLAAAAVSAGTVGRDVGEIVLLRERLDLVRQLPERPRRFLLRLMLGFGYHEIAEAEHTTYRVVNRQVARAKRLLRQLDEHYRDS